MGAQRQNIGSGELGDQTPHSASTYFQLPNPNQKFSFNLSEACDQSYTQTSLNATQQITIAAPSTYNTAAANISFVVMNATLNATTIAGTYSNYDRSEQAQGFIISSDSYFIGFSIYSPLAKNPNTITVGIRNGSYANDDNYTMQINFGGGGWLDFNWTQPIFLAAGHYYLHVPAQSSPSQNAWGHTATSVTGDGWYYSGSWLQAAYDLTLKIQTRQVINITSVAMAVESQPVTQTKMGVGWANVSKIYSGSSVSFSISNNTPIAFSYALNATYYGQHAANINLNLNQTNPIWNLSFPLASSSFTNYRGNVTGLRDDYFSIQAFSGNTSIGYNRLNSTTISLVNPIDQITFQSPNYMTDTQVPNEVHSNQDLELNVSVGAFGNVTVKIYNDTLLVYNASVLDSGTIQFPWHVNTILNSGTYMFEATLFASNQVGYIQQNITLVKVAAIDTYNLSVQALDTMHLNYRLFDLYAGFNIPDASITYYFTDLTGQLQYQGITQNYTKNINLDTFSIPPDNYTLFLEASKAGYQTILVSMPVEITQREMTFEVTRSATELVSGSTLDVTFTPRDQLTGGDLLRPVDVTIKVYRAGGTPEADTIATETIKSISTTDGVSLTIPLTATIGSYDILVRADSSVYMGSVILSGGLTIVEPPNILFEILIIAGIGVVVAGSYVLQQRAVTKRSVRGAIIMNPGGMPLARKISADFSTMNPHLISGAVMGIVTMVKEMTGSSIRTIALEGRYLRIILRKSFWLVILLKRNPFWIRGTLKKLTDDLQQRYGDEIAKWKGEGNLHISLDLSLKRWLGVEIEETREPEIEMAGENALQEQKEEQK